MRNDEKHLCCREPFSRRPLMPPLHASEQRFCITLEASVSITCYSCGNPPHYWELKPPPIPIFIFFFRIYFWIYQQRRQAWTMYHRPQQNLLLEREVANIDIDRRSWPNLIKLSAHSHLPENLEIMQWVKILANHS